MYTARDEAAVAAFRAQESLAGLQSLPLAERAAVAARSAPAQRARCAQIWPLTCTTSFKQKGMAVWRRHDAASVM